MVRLPLGFVALTKAVRKTALLSVLVVVCMSIVCVSCQREAPPDQAALSAEVDRLADLYFDLTMARMPEVGYILGFPPERHDGMFDNSPEALERAHAEDDEMLAALEAIDHGLLEGTPEWITYGILREALEADRGVRVCRSELWSVSHLEGWQAWYPLIAGMQPVGTPELREQALQRWRKLPNRLDNAVANLERGIAQGYTANRAVVERVIQQLDSLVALPLEQSPFMSPAQRDATPEFVEAFRVLVADEILPAIERYRDFLAATYRDAARQSLAVTANPDGGACYTALYRRYTTLDRSPEEIFDLGMRTVEKNSRELVEFGRERYGSGDFEEIIRRNGCQVRSSVVV